MVSELGHRESLIWSLFDLLGVLVVAEDKFVYQRSRTLLFIAGRPRKLVCVIEELWFPGIAWQC